MQTVTIPCLFTFLQRLVSRILLTSLVICLGGWLLHCPNSLAQAPVIDWTNAGYPGAIPNLTSPLRNVKDYGATGNGSTNDTSAIQAAINSAPNPAVIMFPAGSYRLEAPLTLKSGIVLRGEGHNATELACQTYYGCLNIKSWTDESTNYVSIVSGFMKGSNQITVANASGFTIGGFAKIRQDDIVTPEASWGADAVGQLAQIVAINGNTLTIEPALHLDYTLNPRAIPANMITQVGVEDLKLRRINSDASLTNGGYSNINFSWAANCWIRRVESAGTEKYHISVSNALHLEIRDSYIHDADSRGSGGYGYGVSLGYCATALLVENNIFYDIRHSMILQIGVNGCVFGYNYAEKNYSDDDGGWAKTYISLHGHYPFMNLFEGNIIGWIGVGDYWGAIGPGNTFLRNRAMGTDRFDGFGDYHGIQVQYIHGPQYLIGNEVTGGSIYYTIGSQRPPEIPDYAVEHAKVVEHGNNVKGTLTWDPAFPQTIPTSYYLPSKPAFYGAMSWPSIGGDQPLGQGTIPALVRWQQGNYIPSENAYLLWTK